MFPAAWVAVICRLLSYLLWVCLPRRCRASMRDLHHAFPEKTEAWRRQVLQKSLARFFEMGLFCPVSAYFSDQRLDRVMECTLETMECLKRYGVGGKKHGKPVVLLIPHVTMSEAMILIPRKIPELPPIHGIFRPLNQPSLNEWVNVQRERYGVNMISRRSGYNEAMAALRRGECVGVLFDQNASSKGTTITFMERVVSATSLPGLMAHRFKADALLLLPERIGFWKVRLTAQPIPLGASPAEMIIHAHGQLENYLRRDADAAADWFWLHYRWKHCSRPYKRFRLPEKRNEIQLSNQMQGHPSTPRKTRLWVRLPNWLGDVVMALPILRAIRKGRPDFECTLIGKAAFEPLVHLLGVADHFIPLPERGRGYFRSFYKMRKQYPDTYLLLTHSFRADLEAFLSLCPQRFGIQRPGKWRPLLTNPYKLSKEFDQTRMHQTGVWEKMARFYGLREVPDYSPVRRAHIKKCPTRVGLICGSENSPEKRWPISNWRALIRGLLDANPKPEIVLYGTSGDRSITGPVGEGFDKSRVRNLSGKTNLAEFCDEISACAVVCCNDTGGMHLANMLGTELVALFGPTNPLRTGPVFSTGHTVLKPEGSPDVGGMAIEGISTQTCLDAVLSRLSQICK